MIKSDILIIITLILSYGNLFDVPFSCFQDSICNNLVLFDGGKIGKYQKF